MTQVAYEYVDEIDAKPPIGADTVVRYGWPEFRVDCGGVMVQEGSIRRNMRGLCDWTQAYGTDGVIDYHDALYLVVDTDAPSIYLCGSHWETYLDIHKDCIPTPLPLKTLDAVLDGRNGHFRIERVGLDGWRLTQLCGEKKSAIFSFNPDKPFKISPAHHVSVSLKKRQQVFVVYDESERDFNKMLLAVVSDKTKAKTLAKTMSDFDRYFPDQKQLKIKTIRVVS